MPDPVKILLIEDNQDDYEATIRSLKKSRFLNPVDWCKSGQDALDYLYHRGHYLDTMGSSLPDLILLDLNMPGLDGRHVLNVIKSDAALRAIPIIILTTSADENDIEKCYLMGANSYIQKPVNFDGLTQALCKMTDYWFGVAILPPHAPPLEGDPANPVAEG